MRGPVTDKLLFSTPSIVKLLLRGRCPETTGPDPTPTPPELATPAFRRERFNTPLPVEVVGESAISCDSNVVPIVAVVVSIVAAASLTSTVVAVPATLVVMLALATLFRV